MILNQNDNVKQVACFELYPIFKIQNSWWERLINKILWAFLIEYIFYTALRCQITLNQPTITKINSFTYIKI